MNTPVENWQVNLLRSIEKVGSSDAYDVTEYDADFSEGQSAQFLWLCLNEKEQQLINHATQYYSIANGIVLLIGKRDYQEQFYFGSTPENGSINNFYINNLDLLQNFSKRFLEKADALIQRSHEQRILMPSDKKLDRDSPYRRVLSTRSTIPTVQHLSPRESQLLYHLARGASCRKIADELALSVKTVYFYLDNLKRKLGIRQKDKLVNYYWDNKETL